MLFHNETLHLCRFAATKVHYSALNAPRVSPLKPQLFYSEMFDANGALMPGKQCC